MPTYAFNTEQTRRNSGGNAAGSPAAPPSKCHRCKHYWIPRCSIGIGCFFLILTCVVSSLMTKMLQSALNDAGKVKTPDQSQDLYESWAWGNKSDAIPVVGLYYVYNVTNAFDVMLNGDIPSVVELGPYAIQKVSVKFDAQFTEDDSKVSFRTYNYYIERPDLSCATCKFTDKFAFPNLIYYLFSASPTAQGDYLNIGYSLAPAVLAKNFAADMGTSPLLYTPSEYYQLWGSGTTIDGDDSLTDNPLSNWSYTAPFRHEYSYYVKNKLGNDPNGYLNEVQTAMVLNGTYGFISPTNAVPNVPNLFTFLGTVGTIGPDNASIALYNGAITPTQIRYLAAYWQQMAVWALGLGAKPSGALEQRDSFGYPHINSYTWYMRTPTEVFFYYPNDPMLTLLGLSGKKANSAFFPNQTSIEDASGHAPNFWPHHRWGVYTGQSDVNLIDTVYMFKNLTVLPKGAYKGDEKGFYCHDITVEGKMAGIQPACTLDSGLIIKLNPRMSKDDNISVWSDTLYRDMYFIYKEESDVKGIPTWRYSMENSNTLAVNPLYNTEIENIGNLECVYGPKIWYSLPRFAKVGSGFNKNWMVKNMPEVDESLANAYMDFHPYSGFPINAQLNLAFAAYFAPGTRGSTSREKAPDGIAYPLSYILTQVVITDKIADGLKTFELFYKILGPVGFWVGISISLINILVGSFQIWYYWRKDSSVAYKVLPAPAPGSTTQ